MTAIANQGASSTDGISRIESIEKIDINGSGDNILKISVHDVLDMSEMNVFNNATFGGTGLGAQVDKHQVKVIGNAGEIVNLFGGWTRAAEVSDVNNHVWHVYNANDSHAQILIDGQIQGTDIHII